jgi:hypothetical protein
MILSGSMRDATRNGVAPAAWCMSYRAKPLPYSYSYHYGLSTQGIQAKCSLIKTRNIRIEDTLIYSIMLTTSCYPSSTTLNIWSLSSKARKSPFHLSPTAFGSLTPTVSHQGLIKYSFRADYLTDFSSSCPSFLLIILTTVHTSLGPVEG